MKYQQRYRLDEIKKQSYAYYSYHKRKGYTWFKARLYIECASWVVYRLQSVPISPNQITIIYGLLGIIGGALLSLPYKLCVFLALLIFYFKGILDWADGHLARIREETSDLGKWLDSLTGLIGTVCFYLGVGFYMSHYVNLYTVPWVFMICYILKCFGVKVSYAWVTDTIILIIFIHALTY